MVFSSIEFLFYFFPITIALYFLVPKKARNLLLFIASLVFYAWGEPVYVVLMIFSTLVDYSHGIIIEKARAKGKKGTGALISSVIINLALLGFFKYADLFVNTINGIFGTGIAPLNLPLPIGISFYTFQTMSYTIDVYRNEAPVQHNIISFGAFVALFPQLIAGPIVRYQEIADALNKRTITAEKVSSGIHLFICGLAKKVLIANQIGALFTSMQAQSELTLVGSWIGILAFSLQLYFDFSGYSDMARGLGRMLGFEFGENFNYPYISRSVTEFWRRWHISLGTWFREYVYIPLGGNRKGPRMQIRNLFIVWCLTGFWHGAGWNFLLWGLYYGIFIVVEKLFLLKHLEKSKVFSRIYLLFLVVVAWVLFSFDDMGMLGNYLTAMFTGSNGLIVQSDVYAMLSYAMIFVIACIGATPLPRMLWQKLRSKAPRTWAVVTMALCAAALLLCTAFLVDATYNPFLYFRF